MNDKPWVAGINLWTVVPTLVIVLGMAIYGLRLRNELHIHSSHDDLLRESFHNMALLEEEKEKLVAEARKREQENQKRLNGARKVFSSVDNASDFPVNDGEFVVFTTIERFDGVDVLFYAPAGQHKLTLEVGVIERKFPSRKLALSFTSTSGGASKSVSKSFALPPKSRGCLKFRFKNSEGKCLVTARLFDGNENSLDQSEFEFPRKISTGRAIGSSSGTFFYRPGDAGKGFGHYKKSGWHLFKTEQGMKVLDAKVSFTSEADQKFVSVKDIHNHLSRSNFSELFESEVNDGKVLLTPTGEETIGVSRGF